MREMICVLQLTRSSFAIWKGSGPIVGWDVDPLGVGELELMA